MRKRVFQWLDKHLSRQFHHLPVIGQGNYAAHPDISVFSYGNPEQIQYQTPHHQGDLLPEYVNTIGLNEYPAPFILSINNGKIYGRHALITTGDRQILAESVFNHLPYIKDVSSGRIHYPQAMPELIQQMTTSAHYETVFVLANYFGNAYYHWMMESLPRLWLLQQHQQATGQTIPVLLSEPLPDFAQETLKLFGIEDMLFWTATHGVAQNLLLPMAINGTGIPSPYVMRQVSQQLQVAIGDLPEFDCPRIYISRKNSHKRRIINEDEVMTLLEKHGFVSFTLEDMTLAEQIALFKQADIVIGAHGAGFSNCIHSENITLLEFFEPSYINLCFYRLAGGYGFKYAYLTGQSANLNIIIDVFELETLLQTTGIIT